MSKARSPREVCSTTMGTKAIDSDLVFEPSDRALLLTSTTLQSSLAPPSSLRIRPLVRSTQLRLCLRFQSKNQALYDCAICARCYVRPHPLSRQHALVLSIAV